MRIQMLAVYGNRDVQCDTVQVQSWPAERAGAKFRQDSLPRHLHEGGGGAQDQPPGVQGSGRLMIYIYIYIDIEGFRPVLQGLV